MWISRLLFENYRQYYGKHELRVPADSVPSKNIVLIGGLNGSGKTSILTGLRLALYGKGNKDLFPFESYKSFIRGCLNRRAASEGNNTIRLLVTVNSGRAGLTTELTVERIWTFSPELELRSESLYLYSGGNKKLDLSPEEAELLIQEKVPIGVSHFVFFDGERIQDLAQDQLLPAETNAAIRSILGLDVHEALESDLLSYERNLLRTHVKDDGFKNAEIAVDRAEKRLLDCRRQKKNFLIGIENIQRQLREVQAERQRIGGRLQKERYEAEVLVASLREKRQELKARLHLAISQDLPRLKLRPLMHQLRNRLQKELEHEQVCAMENLMKARKADLERVFQQLGGDQVDVLAQAWETVFLSQREKLPATRHSNLSMEQKYSLIQQLEQLDGSHHSDLEEVVQELSKLEFELRRAFSLKRGFPNDPATLDLEEKETHLLNELRDLSTRFGEAQVTERRLERELAVVRRQYLDALNRIQLSRHIDAKVRKVREIREALTNFIDRLARSKAAEVQDLLTHMFLSLSRKTGLVNRFEIDPNTYEIRIVDAEGRVLNTDTLSAGEKEIFALSLLWSLSKAAVCELPMVIDTPLGRLDGTHRRHIAERFLPRANKQVILLSTDSEVDEELYSSLEPYICAQFTIEFNEADNTSIIRPGYFDIGVGNT